MPTLYNTTSWEYANYKTFSAISVFDKIIDNGIIKLKV